jgi:hypothetical protein
LLALLLGVALAAPAEAQDSGGYRVAADGTVEFDEMVFYGTLQNFVMMALPQEPLGIRLLELRQSFIDAILESVRGAPF